MKKLFSFVLTVCMGSLLTLTAYAQEQMPEGQLIAIHEDIVMPSKVGEYEDAAKNLAELFDQNQMTNMSFTAANSEDFTYIYIMPVDGYAGLEKMDAGFDELKNKIGETAYMAAMNKFNDCYDSHRDFLIKLRSDLSYNPDYGSEVSEGLNFRRWDFYYVKPGMEQRAEEIANKWKALYSKHQITEGYRLYMGDLGTDGPLIIVSQPGLNAPDFYSKVERNNKTFGEEGEQLWNETMSIVWKFERKNAAIRPDLSYLPATVATMEN